jgi:hypothetical protein
MNRVRLFIAVTVTVWLAADASAQTVNVKPAKGQSTEQMQKDMAECQGLATQSTGYNPAAAQPSSSTAATQRGGRLRGAATGAVAGAAAAEVRGNRNEDVYDSATHEQREDYRRNQAASAAAAGAVISGSRQRRNRRRTQEDTATKANAGEEAYTQAYSGCMMGRNYTVSP